MDSNPTFHENTTGFVLNMPANAANNVLDLLTTDELTFTTSEKPETNQVTTTTTFHIELTTPFINNILFGNGSRSSDLIRFGLFTGDKYVWDFKGGVAEGKSVEDFFNVYPIPADDINGNENLSQNPRYL